ncbi:MAG: HDOD domain-containing protein [Armatimonadetes bacterium]|nr:HDOD domain-containing protein [Armatimonadota bacterium]
MQARSRLDTDEKGTPVQPTALGVDLESMCVRLKRLDFLPTEPQVARKLISISESNNLAPEELAKVAELEPAFAIRLFREGAHSESAPESLENLVTAVQVTKVPNVLSLMKAHATRTLRRDAYVFRHFSLTEYWRHSVAVAMGSKVLALLTNKVDPEIAYLAGLLHDVGYLVHASQIPAAHEEIFFAARSNREEYGVEEHRRLGWTHAESGAMLCREWCMPAPVVSAAANHHMPEFDNEHYEVSSIVALADRMAHETGFANASTAPPAATALLLNQLKLAPAQVGAISQVMVNHVLRAQSILDVHQ